MPSEAYTSRARPTAAAEVARPATTSTRGSRYTGLKGCPTSNRPGCTRSRCMSLGSSPEVEDPMTTSGAAAASTSARTARLRSSRSGTLSWMNSAPSTASSTLGAIRSAPRAGRASPKRRAKMCSALSRTSFALRSVSGSGSWTAVSIPFRTNRAAHPPPMTPPPMHAARWMQVIAMPSFYCLCPRARPARFRIRRSGYTRCALATLSGRRGSIA